MLTHLTNIRQAILDTAFIPLFGLAALFIIYFFNLNQDLFLHINSVSQYTGQWLWSALTLFGDPVVLLCIALSLHVFHKKQLAIARISFSILPTLFIGGITVFYFKWLFAVVRPPGVLQDIIVIGQAPISGAFPSGHTTGIFAFATLIILQLARRPINPSIKISIFLFALIIGASRIAVGAHWPLDVSAGIILGWMCAIAGFYVSRHYSQSNKQTTAINALLFISAVFLLFKNTGAAQAYSIQLIIAVVSLSIASFSLYSHYKLRSHDKRFSNNE